MLKDMFRVELNSAIHPCALMQRKKRRNKLRYRPHIRLTLKRFVYTVDSNNFNLVILPQVHRQKR
jgi:hypothetical protein